MSAFHPLRTLGPLGMLGSHTLIVPLTTGKLFRLIVRMRGGRFPGNRAIFLAIPPASSTVHLDEISASDSKPALVG
jgi:hypothetical protein